MSEPANDATINNQTGGSSVPVERGGLVSTVEFTSKAPTTDTDPEGAKKETEGTDDGSKKAGQEEAGKTDTETDKGKEKETLSGEEDRFDKHPRFIELRTRAENSERLINQLQSQITELTKRPTSEGAEQLPFKDTSNMTKEELLDWQSEDPHGYHKNVLAQAKYEIEQSLNGRFEQETGENAIVATFDSFAKENPDFDDMWDRGLLQAFMNKNPGHNAISAYLVLTQDDKQKIAIEKAVSDAEKTFAANQKAKRTKASLGGGPQTAGSGSELVDAELQDTKKFGGPISVMARRLKIRRSQAGL